MNINQMQREFMALRDRVEQANKQPFSIEGRKTYEGALASLGVFVLTHADNIQFQPKKAKNGKKGNTHAR